MWIYLFCIGTGMVISQLLQRSSEIEQIYTSISEHTPSKLKSLFRTMKTICKLKYREIHNHYVQKLKQSTPLTKDKYLVDYYHNGQRYFILLKDSKDCHQYEAYDQDGNDVSTTIRLYGGPNYDFHSQVVTQEDLNLTKIVLVQNDNNRVYTNKDRLGS
jgi:hypothetical protein